MESALKIHPKAYRFFPKRAQQKTKFEKSGVRFYFYGQIEHDDYEKRKMKEFYQYIAKQKLKIPNPDFFTDQKVLLILQGNGYKNEKTYEAIIRHSEWRIKMLPPKLSSKAEQILKSGCFYVSGRDSRFRPIMVTNARLIDFNLVQECLEACIYFHEWIIHSFFLPGQIENWVVIYDIGGMGVTQIPINACKRVFTQLSNNYGGRLYRLYVVNCPFSLKLTWKIVSTVLDDVTVQKITIESDIDIPGIWKLCDKSQVEQKFGGTQPNITKFWPLSLPQAVIDQSLLVSKEQYVKMYKDGKLKRNIIDPEVLNGQTKN